ncbi:sigma-70 family RNA polymerase sigma factor [Henriciella barbarensis]|uniref:Sigma-70 family RNA polymerase sigma factor n=1 Tax=Henriciella barbarensis TaxID=86342 RepID=A0A399QSB8_9PROT|nr:sigma-70 family RNA polymerase sigma factor [Henriciella barbarensis]
MSDAAAIARFDDFLPRNSHGRRYAQNVSDSSERDQIARAAAGDRMAQSALVNRHMPVVWRVAFRMLRDRQEAEDVTQETFLRAWKMLPEWEGRAKFSTWACTVAINLCRDRMKKKTPVLMETLPEREAGDLPPEQALHQKQAGARIATMIDALPERQKEALTLSALEGLGNKEAAAAMQVSVEALESLLSRARRTLRQALAEGQEE